MQTPHDRLVHAVFADPQQAAALLRVALGPELAADVDWSTLAECSEILVDVALRRRELDLRFRAERRRGGERLFLLEHKAEEEPQTVMQVFGYETRILEQRFEQDPKAPLPLLTTVILHHGRAPWRGPTSLAALLDARGSEVRTDCRPILFDLTRLDEAAIAALDLPPLARLALLHLRIARWLAPADVVAALRRWAPWYREAAAAGGHARLQVFLSYTLHVNEVPHRELADVLAEILRPEAREDVMSTAEKLVAEGMAKGMAKGKAEGKAELLLLQLQTRFGAAAESVAARVRGAAEHDLDRWALRLLAATSIEDVFAT